MTIQGPASLVPAMQQQAQDPIVSMIAMVERAARDPSVDIVKMEKLFDRLEFFRAQQAEQAFNESMSIVQGKMRAVAADASNPSTKSRYATYFALDKALRPIYTGEGLGLSYDTEDSPHPEMVRVVCYATKGLFTRKYKVDMPADGKGARGGDVMTKTHAAGSAMTYGQRYLLKMIFNIAIGSDDDGNAAGDQNPAHEITAAQLKELRDLIAEVRADEAKVCKACHVATLEDITSKNFEKARAKLVSMRSPL
ncbi:ERF family protein [Bradyrhizobium cenepequi]|uniref:ERF family protein n=1 Tax=Bradyrhizobium cenepequi TaxID=2821403 RepID=UPI001CE34409|nr:ERF family protein [Bradyrhizobium cenepequi]MCA6108163.1 ERF family protein [Bradyrhizobium cenepequi]